MSKKQRRWAFYGVLVAILVGVIVVGGKVRIDRLQTQVVEKYGITYGILLGDQEVFTRFQGFGIPYTLVLNREQHIVSIYRGPVTREMLEQDVQKIQQGV